MKLASIFARYLLGLIFTVFGLNGFLNFIHQPPPANPLAIQNREEQCGKMRLADGDKKLNCSVGCCCFQLRVPSGLRATRKSLDGTEHT